ncbi:cellulose synthase complex outer membrane protein BcsC [Erwinia sp. CGal63]|uniref:cellulose synthase complex outer membrane protein BcsC n=1 Tax=Erwinia sp. CGal63 TaxID=2919889 RepID=UPI0030095C70
MSPRWIAPALLLPLGCVAAQAAEVAPLDWLLQQVRVGEATNKFDLVSQSLYRLEKIAPDNPQVVAAQIRQDLRMGQQDRARERLARLKKLAPDALSTRQAEASLVLISDEGRQQFQQARLLAASGRLPEARAAWDKLFHGVFPSNDIALEYWRLVARLPDQQPEALKQLETLDRDAPGSINVKMAIAQLQLSQDNRAAAVKQLQEVANEPAGRTQAAELWLSDIKSQPVTPETVAQLKTYLQTFTSDKPQADGQLELARQEKMLADPAYQQRLRGLALIDKGESTAAIPALRAALKASPNDADLLGAMGQALARANQREEADGYFQRAVAADAQGTDIGKWQSLLKSNRYWLAIAAGDKALAAGDIRGATRSYQQAQSLDNTDGYALIGLGDVALAQKNSQAAESLFRRARQIDPGNATATQRLVNLYQQQSPEKALAFINGLPAAQKRSLGATLVSLRSSTLSAEGDKQAAAGRWAQAAEQYRQAQQGAPDDVWLNYRLAGALRQAGQPQAADRQMAAMAQRQPGAPTQVYAYALYLSGSDRAEEALRQLHTLPAEKQDQNIKELTARLETDRVIARADQLRASGQESQAIALLGQLPPSSRITLTEADWALERGDAEQALARYRDVSEKEPQNNDARLGEIEALVALKDLPAAKARLQALPPAIAEESVNTGRRVANAAQSVGDTARAATLYGLLKPKAAQEMPSQSSALVFRDAARLEAAQNQPAAAQYDYRQAMVASGIAAAPPQSTEEYTRLTRNDERDDWLKRGIRSEAADLARQQDTVLTLEEDYARNKGTGGVSDFTAHTTMMQAETPFGQGKGWLRLDNVDISAGTFSRNSLGNIDENYGTCANDDATCNRDFRQHQNGTSVGVGYNSDKWSADIGTTPLGFEVTNWVGGFTWNTSVKDLGVSLTASRRPISSSLLAYAGARDPNTASGKTWGGVVATGGAVGLSYDQGGAHGVWADISAHQITGENVKDNSRERLMAGYYYKLINENNRRATIGLNGMLWHYAQDLSDYSLGQGGYYSPQSYNSLSVPLTYRQRTENWSFDLGGSVSWSHSRTRGQSRYPLSFGALTSDNPRGDSSSSSGFGYTLQAVVERRLSAHWTLGLGMDIQQAKDYTPSHGMLYLRYSMAGWEGDLDMPPQPLTPYADFK